MEVFTAILVILVLAVGLLRDRRPLPRLPNILRNLGIGPILLQDTYSIWEPWSPVSAPAGVMWGLTCLALISTALCAGAAVGILISRSQPQWMIIPSYCRRLQHMFLMFVGALLVLAPYNPLTIIYYDRYLLAGTVPFVLVAAAGLPKRSPPHWFRPVAVACTLLYIFSLVGLQDYMAWHRARWEAIEFLRTELGANDGQVDGGYEFNGMYTSEKFMKRKGTKNVGNQGNKGWWVIGDRYRVAMTPQDRYEIVQRFPYFSWLGFETREVLALERAKHRPEGPPSKKPR